MENTNKISQSYEIINDSLDAIYGSGTDIVDPFYKKLFEEYPGSEDGFHDSVSIQGNMLNEIMGTFLAIAAGESWVENFVHEQVVAHRGYADIPLAQYRRALDLFVTVLAEAAGEKWCAEWSRCWREQADALFSIVERYY